MNKFVQFYLDNKGIVYLKAFEVCNGRYHDAEDLIQDVLVDLLQKKDDNQEGSLSAFWTTCLKFKYISKWRTTKSQLQRTASDCWQSERKEIKKIGEVVNYDSTIDSKLILQEINNLNSFRARQVMNMLIEGNSQKDIAQLTGIGYHTIRKSLKRGRKALKVKLLAHGFDIRDLSTPRTLSYYSKVNETE